MDYGLCSIIVALITGLSSIITAIIWGYVPKRRQEEVVRLKKELLDVYMGAYNLKVIEDLLEEEESRISKQEARRGLIITSRLEKGRIEKRLTQLKSDLD